LKIYVPDSVIDFGEGCLGASYDTTVYCNKYSQAHSYAVDHDYKVSLLDGKPFSKIGSILLGDCDPYMTPGDRRPLNPTVYPDTYTSISFSSSAPDIISIDGGGMLTAKEQGTAIITVNVDGVKASLTMTSYVPLDGFGISCAGYLVNPGKTKQLYVDRDPEDAMEPVFWEVSNTNLATIDQNGLLTARVKGDVTVYATSLSGDTCEVDISIVGRPTVLEL